LFWFHIILRNFREGATCLYFTGKGNKKRNLSDTSR